MNFTAKLELTDYLNANFLFAKTLKTNHYFPSIVFCFFISGLTMKLLTTEYFYFAEILFYSGLILTIVFFAVTFLQIHALTRLSWKKHKSLRDEMTFEIDDNILNIKTNLVESKISWKTFIAYSEDSKIYLFFHSFNLFTVIPKRWFSSEEDIIEIRNYLKKNEIPEYIFSGKHKLFSYYIIPLAVGLISAFIFYYR